MTGRTWTDGDTTGLMCLPESTVAVAAGSTEADILGGCWWPAAPGLRLITMVVVFPSGTEEADPIVRWLSWQWRHIAIHVVDFGTTVTAIERVPPVVADRTPI